jgi:hypothetical protein
MPLELTLRYTASGRSTAAVALVHSYTAVAAIAAVCGFAVCC